jgi:hypothetical protein
MADDDRPVVAGAGAGAAREAVASQWPMMIDLWHFTRRFEDAKKI